MTQEELGRILGVQKSAVQKYEKGTVKNIKPEIISKLCITFQVNPGVFLDVLNDTTRLSHEVRLLDGIKMIWGQKTVDMLEYFVNLNDDGKEKLIEYAQDLSDLDKYTK